MVKNAVVAIASKTEVETKPFDLTEPTIGEDSKPNERKAARSVVIANPETTEEGGFFKLAEAILLDAKTQIILGSISKVFPSA